MVNITKQLALLSVFFFVVGCSTDITKVEQQDKYAVLTVSKTSHLKAAQTLQIVGSNHPGGDEGFHIGKARVEKILDNHRVIVSVVSGTISGATSMWVIK